MDRVLPRRKFPVGWVLGLGTLACLGAVFAYQLLVVDRKQVHVVRGSEIRIATVMKGIFQESFLANGYIAPQKSIFVDSQENGVVRAVNAEQGSIVHKGTALIMLRNDELESQRELNEASLRDTERQLEEQAIRVREMENQNRQALLELDHQIELARDDRDTKKVQLDMNAISRAAYDRAVREWEFLLRKRELLAASQEMELALLHQQEAKIRGALDVTTISLRRVAQRIEALTIVSPAYGQITSFDASVGEMKIAGSHIAQLDIMETLKLKADLDEYYLPRITVGSEGYFTFPNASGEGVCHVAASWISPDVKNSSFEVQFAFTSPPPKIRIGQRFLVRILLGPRTQAVMLDQGQYFQSHGTGWVFVVDPSGATARRRDIRIGRSSPEYIEVTEGLAPGEQVIVSDYSGFTGAEEIRIR